MTYLIGSQLKRTDEKLATVRNQRQKHNGVSSQKGTIPVYTTRQVVYMYIFTLLSMILSVYLVKKLLILTTEIHLDTLLCDLKKCILVGCTSLAKVSDDKKFCFNCDVPGLISFIEIVSTIYMYLYYLLQRDTI